MPDHKLPPDQGQKIALVQSEIDSAQEAIDRATDGIVRIRMGHEGREHVLRKLSFAMDHLSKAIQVIAQVPIYERYPQG